MSKGKNKESKEIIQSENVENVEFTDLKNLNLIKYSLKEQDGNDPVKQRVKELIIAILNLKRDIKAREEDLSPKYW